MAYVNALGRNCTQTNCNRTLDRINKINKQNEIKSSSTKTTTTRERQLEIQLTSEKYTHTMSLLKATENPHDLNPSLNHSNALLKKIQFDGEFRSSFINILCTLYVFLLLFERYIFFCVLFSFHYTYKKRTKHRRALQRKSKIERKKSGGPFI